VVNGGISGRWERGFTFRSGAATATKMDPEDKHHTPEDQHSGSAEDGRSASCKHPPPPSSLSDEAARGAATSFREMATWLWPAVADIAADLATPLAPKPRRPKESPSLTQTPALDFKSWGRACRGDDTRSRPQP